MIVTTTGAADRAVPVGDASSMGGRLDGEGRIAAMSPPALEAMGFAATDDLRGLDIAAFWAPGDRSVLASALRMVREGRPASVLLDLAYLGGLRDDVVCLALSPALDAGIDLLVEGPA